MAEITQELHAIRTAIYGEDVRGSIHNAIKKINEQANTATEFSEGQKDSAKAYAEAAQQALAQSQQTSSDMNTTLQTAQTNLTNQMNAQNEAVNKAISESRELMEGVIQTAQTAFDNTIAQAGEYAQEAKGYRDETKTLRDKVSQIADQVKNMAFNEFDVYDPLLDSDGNEILDSEGQPLLARIIFLIK